MDRTLQGMVDAHTAASNRGRNLERKVDDLEKEVKTLRATIKKMEKQLRIVEARSKPRSGAYI